MNITEFLLARIAEDEALALAAAPGPWRLDDEEQTVRAREYAGEIVFDRSAEHSSEWVKNFRPTAEFIARNEPARVLAECAAKRAIVRRFEDAEESYVALSYVIEALAAVYKDHPDYQEAWAVAS